MDIQEVIKLLDKSKISLKDFQTDVKASNKGGFEFDSFPINDILIAPESDWQTVKRHIKQKGVNNMEALTDLEFIKRDDLNVFLFYTNRDGFPKFVYLKDWMSRRPNR